MSLFGKSEKQEIDQLKAQLYDKEAEISRLMEQIQPEQVELSSLLAEIEAAKSSLQKIRAEVEAAKQELSKAREQIIETDEAALLQSFGIYTPHYYYSTSEEYKIRLKENREKQKEYVKSGRAVVGNENWQVNGNSSQGKKMVHDMQKLLLRAFNAECDDSIEHVRFNNIEACEKKILASYEATAKLGRIMNISITRPYMEFKLEELRLMHEYQVKKQDEKEEARELRQRQREEAKAQKELEEAKRKLEKEQSHYENALSRLDEQIKNASPDERAVLEEKRSRLKEKLKEIEEDISQVDYRASNQRAGYVYIISNIGAFGENVYKIGMTRRLDPMERVDELGDASVPFNFDVHAMIFTEDAPALEAALHTAFANKKVNFVNHRREFFNVSLDEIKVVVRKNFDKTVEFIDVPPAEQYRESLKLKEKPV